jgi:transposase-like protein
MKRARHTEEQIIAVPQESQAGAIEELCRRHGISQPTYYKSKQKLDWRSHDLQLHPSHLRLKLPSPTTLKQ